MASCDKHGNVQCRFFCTTCSAPVCYVCMERGDHVIPKHQCIPVSQYCEKKSNEIRTVIHGAEQHKTRYDQIKIKWDTHLGSLEEEFEKLKSEIRLTKQHFLQQMDLAEQSLLKTAGIAKIRKETAIKSAKDKHEQRFCGTYQQLNEKCQFLLQKLSNQNFGEEHAFQECSNLLNTLHEDLKNFDKEDMLGIKFTFLPSTTCSLGEVITPMDADCRLGSEMESLKKECTEPPAQKRMRTETDAETPLTKQEHEYPPSTSKNGKSSNNDINIASTSASYVNGSTRISTESKLTLNATLCSKPNTSHSMKSPVRTSLNEKSKPAISSLDRDNNLPSSANNLQTYESVDSRCSGIVWVDNDRLFEVLTNTSFISVKHHKISNLGQVHPNLNVKCGQNMENVHISVCPKLHSPDCSFVLAFNDQVAIIRLKGNKGGDVTWKRIPKNYAIIAISWRKVPSNYVAIVKGQDGNISLLRDTSENSGKPQFEVRDLFSLDFNRCHPFDVTSNNEFAICNTLSDRILYYSSLGDLGPTREVAGPPCLINSKPISVLVRDNQKEWLALWKGKSPSDKQLKWAIIRYNVDFYPSATVTQGFYANTNEEPKAFSVYGNKLAILQNNFRIIFDHGLSALSQ